jgi:GT2 family glycosyltransferase
MNQRVQLVKRRFPERGGINDFREVLLLSRQIIVDEGIWSFVGKVVEKIRRREFGLVDPIRKRTMMKQTTLPDAVISPSKFSDIVLINQLRAFLSNGETLEFSGTANPRTSIIVVTYNRAHYAYECLRYLLRANLSSYELIIVDNASTDDTPGLLRKTRNAKVILNSRNLSLAHASNQGASAAKGEYLLFVNHDVFIAPDCASWMTKTFNSDSRIGAVGSKLLSFGARLLEAGSIIWRDGTSLGYGRGDDPAKPEYCYVREVDYCSGACLMLKRDAFLAVGGFDESFKPAYYEDTDLCMRLWEHGFRVVYQPLAVATHAEFSSSSFERAVSLMTKQRRVFVHRHKRTLKTKFNQSSTNIIRARDSSHAPRILIIDDSVPTPADGTGNPRMYLMLRTIAGLGYRVTLLPVIDATPRQPETRLLTQSGIEVLWGTIGIREVLETRSSYYDIVIISRPYNALVTMDLVRETNPKARIIYDAEALWFRREEQRRSLGLPPLDPRFESEKTELSLIRTADYVISVSSTEKKIIQEKNHDKDNVVVIGHPHRTVPTDTAFKDRHDLLFLGGFKSAPGPNDDAVVHFTEKILPRIIEKRPELRLLIAGSNPPKSVKELASNSVSVLGYVADLKEVYARARVFIAPMRFGAGIMWKVTEAMSYGLPCVLSRVAAEGLKIRNRREVLVADDDEAFADNTVELYEDEALWAHLRRQGLAYVKRNCDPTDIEKRLGDLLARAS